MKTLSPPPAAPLVLRTLHPSVSTVGHPSLGDVSAVRSARSVRHLALVPTGAATTIASPSGPADATTSDAAASPARTTAAPTITVGTATTRVARPRTIPDTLRNRNEDRCWRLAGPANPLTADDLDWGAVGNTTLDPDTIACLVYMRDVEGFTDQYVAGFAGHPTTLADPVISAFVDTWQTEEAAHSAVLDRFLTTYAAATNTVIPAPPASTAVTVPMWERLGVQATRPVGHVIAATHMVWGAANELLTVNGYRLLAHRCGDPVLSDLLTRIAAQESRHYSFYSLQAEWRLADSRLARWGVRRLLTGAWTPVGIGDGYKSRADFDLLLRHLIPGAEGERAISRMDARFDRLPGLAGLDLFTRTVEAATA